MTNDEKDSTMGIRMSNFNSCVRPRSRGAHGFSLVEILVVVGVIAALVGMIVVVGAGKMRTRQKIDMTHAALTSLMLAATEYRATTGSWPDILSLLGQTRPHNVGGVGGSGRVDDRVEAFIVLMNQYTTSGQIVRGITKDLLGDVDEDGFLDVVDAWGRRVEYVLQDEVAGQSGLQGRPGQPYFASSGEDMEFGTEDDIYSYETTR